MSARKWLPKFVDEELARDDDVVVYGEDVGIDGGVFRATQELIESHPEQVHDSPLAEAGIVGLGIGLAATGFRPVPEIQFQSFLYQGFHQLQQHASRIRSRSRGTLSCPMTIRTPYGGGIRALEHHSDSYEAGFAHIPGLKVVIPSTPADTKGLLTAAIRDPEPVPEGEHVVPLGEASVRRHGEELTVVSWGSMVREAVDAVEGTGVSADVIDLRTVSPMDADTVVESVERTGRCVVVHEGARTAGMAAEIVARITDEAFLSLEAPVERVTGYDVPVPMFAREEAYLPDSDRVATAIERTMEF